MFKYEEIVLERVSLPVGREEKEEERGARSGKGPAQHFRDSWGSLH
jgi:hypothetical protein